MGLCDLENWDMTNMGGLDDNFVGGVFHSCTDILCWLIRIYLIWIWKGIKLGERWVVGSPSYVF